MKSGNFVKIRIAFFTKGSCWQVRDRSGNLTESLAALKAAKENHNRIEKRVLNQSEEHKEIVSSICSDMAVLMARLRDFNGAIKCYKEALAVKPNDTKILVALCRLYIQVLLLKCLVLLRESTELILWF